jgi:cholesterol transport system auxiliary component
MNIRNRPVLLFAPLLLALPGCISLGGPPPESLLTLSPPRGRLPGRGPLPDRSSR